MPFFSRSGRFHSVAYITGPTHNLLRVAFAAEFTPEPEMIVLPASGVCGHGALDPERIRAAVLEASVEANLTLGSTFFPAAIAYVSNDTPQYSLYGLCAFLLVRRLASGEPFEEVSLP